MERRLGIARAGMVFGAVLALAVTVLAEGSEAVAPTPAPAAEAGTPVSKLGLAERRALKAYQDEKYPELLKSIRAAAGFELEVEVNWEAIALLGDADNYTEDNYWTKIFFVPLAEALKQVGKDEMGLTALKKGLKKVVISYDEATAPASNYLNGVSFESGVLSINFHPFSNSDEVTGRTEALVKTLEPKL